MSRPRLTRRDLVLSVAIALVAATLAGVGAAAVLGDGSSDGGEGQGSDLTLATVTAAPDDEYPRLDGTRTSIAEYRGRPVVVNFFGSWCAPCKREMPALEQVHRDLGDEVAFLGLNVRDPVERARALVDTTGVTYDIGRDPSGDLAREWGVTTFPTTAFVAPDGSVVRVHSGALTEGELRRLVTEELG